VSSQVYIVLRSSEGERDLAVDARRPDATVNDLLRAALGPHAPESVFIGERVVAGACPLADAGLHAGAVVSTVPDPVGNGGGPPRSQFELMVVAGAESGRRFPLAVGRSSVGRTAGTTIVLDDPSVSRHHCEIDLDASGACTVLDSGSANGTFVDGVAIDRDTPVAVALGGLIEIGAFMLAIRSVADVDRPRSLDLRRQVGPTGTAPFNRPPRPARAAAATTVAVPKAPDKPAKPHFSVASTMGPLVMAGVMVLITKNFQYALFTLLTPVIGLGSYVESRRRTSKGKAQSHGAYESELSAFKVRIAEAADAERERLRDMCPDPAEALRRAALPSVRLWERRPHHADFLRLYAGLADLSWTPPVEEHHGELPAEVAKLLASSALASAPVCVDLSGGGVVGIVGDRPTALAAARSLICQAAVHQGPADLTIGVFADPGRAPDWDWCKWLPHARDNAGSGDERWLSDKRVRSDALLRRLIGGGGTGTVLAVLDSDVLTVGKNAPARDLLRVGAESRDPDARGWGRREDTIAVAGIVIATSGDRLPSACNTVIQIDSLSGDATIRRPEEGIDTTDVLLAGLETPLALACARDLARFEDPELRQVAGGLPDGVSMLSILQLDRLDAEAIGVRWRRSGSDPGAVVPLGVTESGVFTLDLVRDGPHGLVGGTTGSGKSELLKCLVAGLAAHTDPAHLTFILMDFKGGAAFDDCTRLPHTVGMVTDLDEQLGERALEALEAEIHYRERLLRSVGAENLRQYLAGDPAEPMPRLIVVIDEFATMAKEFPDFLSALVSVAQRGRTLGVHMILATQRPSGAVNENIRTNTNLRIALRVQDANDSTDVIGRPDAAELSRHLPGRAYIRLGPGEVVPIQTAFLGSGRRDGSDPMVAVAPFAFGPPPAEDRRSVSTAGDDRPAPESDLERLVGAIVAANEAAGIAPPRRPWPEPLPATIELAGLLPAKPSSDGARAIAALADDPRRQTQYPVGWELGEGNLLLFGMPGSGTTTALGSLALSLATAFSPDELELFGLDYGTGQLQALEALPHTGAVVLAGDRERQMRLIRHLRGELERRRGAPATRRTVVLIDNLAALRAEFDDAEGLELVDALTRVYADGQAVGIWFAVAADRLNTVPGPWAAVTTQEWLFRLADPYDYVSAGLDRRDVPPAIAGRAVMAHNGLQIQVGMPAPSFTDAVEAVNVRYPQASRVASPIGVLPERVSLASLQAVAQLSEEPWRIPFGVRESDLAAAELVLYEGEHALVAGPARSGKSTALWTIAESLRGAGGDVHVAAIAGRRSPLRDCPVPDRLADIGGEATAMLALLRTVPGPVVLLIDDAENLEDADGAIAGLLAAAGPNLHVIAAGRSDSLRSLYGHWTKTIARSKSGLLLKPNIDFDGDLLGAALPRRAPVQMIVGRGYVVSNGEVEIVQVAKPG
jgi:DNA segregation ATPase FtsK/SpoIIIE, S-DNA-T family